MIDGSQTWLNLAKLIVHTYQDVNLTIIGLKWHFTIMIEVYGMGRR